MYLNLYPVFPVSLQIQNLVLPVRCKFSSLRTDFNLCSPGLTTFCLILKFNYSAESDCDFSQAELILVIDGTKSTQMMPVLFSFEKSTCILIILTYFPGIWEKTSNFPFFQLAFFQRLNEV